MISASLSCFLRAGLRLGLGFSLGKGLLPVGAQKIIAFLPALH